MTTGGEAGSAGGATPLEFNPFDPLYRNEPYSRLSRLRSESPIFRSDLGFLLLTQYADVDSVLRSSNFVLAEDAGSSRFTPGSMIGRVCTDAFLFRNPPDHTRLRALVSRGFSPGMVNRLESSIRGGAERLLSKVSGEGELDLVKEFSQPFPLATICDLVGIDEADRGLVGSWSESLCPTLDPVVSGDTVKKLDAAVGEFGEFLLVRAKRKLSDPKDDLLSTLASLWSRGQIAPGELVASCVLILAAGHETTSNLIASGMLSLLRSPGELHRLRQDSALMSSAIDEMLRTESPIQMFLRWAEDDCRIGDVEIEAGQVVAVHIGAANRDPVVFEGADRFDVGRETNRHLAFGAGIHFCLGAALAKAEAATAIESILNHMSELELLEAPEWKDTVTVRGPKSLRVSYRCVV